MHTTQIVKRGKRGDGMMRPTISFRSGITLIELIIAMSFSVIVIVVVSISQDQFNRATFFVNQELENRQDFQQIFQVFESEVRGAGPSSVGSYPVELATSTSFIFYNDVDGDLLMERVRYEVGTSTLNRGIIKPTGNPLVYVTSTEIILPVLTNVLAASSTFRYFGTSYTGSEAPLTYPVDPTTVRLVRLTVYADVNPSFAPQPTIFTRTITLRNLRSN